MLQSGRKLVREPPWPTWIDSSGADASMHGIVGYSCFPCECLVTPGSVRPLQVAPRLTFTQLGSRFTHTSTFVVAHIQARMTCVHGILNGSVTELLLWCSNRVKRCFPKPRSYYHSQEARADRQRCAEHRTKCRLPCRQVVQHVHRAGAKGLLAEPSGLRSFLIEECSTARLGSFGWRRCLRQAILPGK